MKAFKYFDLNNNGTVEPEEFGKAIEKIGIQIPTKKVCLIFSYCFGARIEHAFVSDFPFLQVLPFLKPMILTNILYLIGLGRTLQHL